MWEHPSKDFMVVDKKIMKEVQYLMIELHSCFYLCYFVKMNCRRKGSTRLSWSPRKDTRGAGWSSTWQTATTRVIGLAASFLGSNLVALCMWSWDMFRLVQVHRNWKHRSSDTVAPSFSERSLFQISRQTNKFECSVVTLLIHESFFQTLESSGSLESWAQQRLMG